MRLQVLNVKCSCWIRGLIHYPYSWVATIKRNKVRDRLKKLANSFNAQGGTAAMDRLADVADIEEANQLSKSGTIGNSDNTLNQDLGKVIDHRQLESRISTRILKLVRENCDERTWQAFWLTTALEMPAADVARELGISPSSVYQAKSRILGGFELVWMSCRNSRFFGACLFSREKKFQRCQTPSLLLVEPIN